MSVSVVLDAKQKIPTKATHKRCEIEYLPSQFYHSCWKELPLKNLVNNLTGLLIIHILYLSSFNTLYSNTNGFIYIYFKCIYKITVYNFALPYFWKMKGWVATRNKCMLAEIYAHGINCLCQYINYKNTNMSNRKIILHSTLTLSPKSPDTLNQNKDYNK
jgi:hypothetical protein